MPPEYENVFYLRLLELANNAGLCTVLFSDAYGNPQIDEFAARRPVLDAMLSRRCANGRYHAIGYHVYQGVSGGDWLFGRYRLFMAAVGRQYERLPILVTEYSAGTGRGAVDCAALWRDQQAAERAFSAQIVGYHLYSVGQGSEWSDISSCLGQGV